MVYVDMARNVQKSHMDYHLTSDNEIVEFDWNKKVLEKLDGLFIISVVVFADSAIVDFKRGLRIYLRSVNFTINIPNNCNVKPRFLILFSDCHGEQNTNDDNIDGNDSAICISGKYLILKLALTFCMLITNDRSHMLHGNCLRSSVCMRM